MTNETTTEKLTILVLGMVWFALTVAADGGIILVAWYRLAMPLFHPAFHMTYAAACGVDILQNVVLARYGQRASGEDVGLKKQFVDGVARGTVLRVMMIVTVIVAAWVLT